MGLRPHVLHGTGRFKTEPPDGFKHGHRLDTVLLQMKLGEGIVLCQKIRVLCSEAGIREHLPPFIFISIAYLFHQRLSHHLP